VTCKGGLTPPLRFKNMREKIMSLLSGKKIDLQPVFSGLIHVTQEGLQSEGLILYETHRDAQKMASAAESTFKSTGMPSAALPLDLCAPAEILGAQLNYYEGGEFQFPQVKQALFESVKEITTENTKITHQGRLKIICDAIELVKKDIGNDAVVSGTIPGPYTLLLYLCDPKNLFTEMKKEPDSVTLALLHLSSFLAEIGTAYKNAGADFITIHDMGGSPGFIGPVKYEQFVLPAEKLLMEGLSGPTVLSVCGNVTRSLPLLAQTGAAAISLDQTVDLAAARLALPDTLLFGNLDPVATLYLGGEAQIRESVLRAKAAGVDAVWPGCDMVLQTPSQNIHAMLNA
jgi:MtaA/CmuA family methyltransferase